MPQPVVGAPAWLESTLNVTAGRDPLGMQTITTDRIVPRLVPGVLALSRRARYLSFHAFLLDDYQRQQLTPSNSGLSEFIKRREYELSLAIQLCPNGCGSQPVASVGRERTGPVVNSGLAAFPRGESVKSYLGGYGLYYRTPMVDFGLVAPRGTPLGEEEKPTPVDILWQPDARAAALAAAFREAIEGTEYFTGYYGGTHDIPREVLVEYSERACLCRLPEFPGERAALAEALLVPSPRQVAADVTRRREAFAFLLWLAERDESVVRVTEAFRRVLWDAHEHGETGASPVLRATGARWAALIAKEFMQESVSSLWRGVCRTGLAAGQAGIASGEFDLLMIGPLVDQTVLHPFEHEVAVGGETGTASFAAAMTAATSGRSLEDVRAWAVADGSSLAGLGLLLVVHGRIDSMGTQPEGWAEVSMQDGGRQPGLARMMVWLGEHLRADPTVRATITWLVRELVIWPHEAIAYSKLPESTFRFRWESGRLHFFDLDPERFGLTDIRRDALGRLGVDIGLLDWTTDGAMPTGAGRALVAEVFG